ncbi:MAG: aspartate/glutamate racemase family protein [Deltaproteobacteria bacterium]|nr:aspartate/glutamate racemase family protein [Deltaproteobacteria bacterium]
MGPEATVDLQQRVLRATPAEDDADHLRMIVDNNPQIPSRIKALIEGTGESPVPVLRDMARRLEAYGADLLAIPCNTAHTYFEDLRTAVQIPVLNMIELTVERIGQENPGLKRVGVLASTAVIRQGLYLEPFDRYGIEILYPAEERQQQIMQVIRKVKTGRPGPMEQEALRLASRQLICQGAEVLIVACTELSLLSGDLAPAVPIYDTAQVLAEAIVRTAKDKG